MSNQITKDDLLNFTHQLHCKLRSAKGIKLTGLPALNEIENILLFRFIEEIKEINLDKEIKFTRICEKYATDEKIKEDKKQPYLKDKNCYKLWNEFYNEFYNEGCIIRKYLDNELIKKYISSSVQKISVFTDSKRAEVSANIQEMFNMVYNKFKNINFDSTFYDMFGTAHEQFKTNDHGNGGKHTGQHFTPMDIKRLTTEELKIKSNEIYYEPCAGTGGFIHTVDKYVRDNEGDKASLKFKKNIYANECNPEIIKPLMINMLLHNIPVENINEIDSLSDINIISMKGKADVIATNYPFGMSNTINLDDYTDKKYWGCLLRGKNVIKNSSGQFILHIYNSLTDKGRAGFVSDRGILNNGDEKSWEHDLRKFLVENTNIYKIWLLPNGVFPYTSFATCAIFIRKGEETKKLKIYEGKFKDVKNKSGLYIDDKPIKVFTKKELKDNKYSFKLEDKAEEIKEGWVKLGDIIMFEKKSTHKAGDSDENGKYTYYTSSSIKKKSEYCDFTENRIILGTGGSANVNYDSNFSCSADNFIINIIDNKYNLKCLYYYLKINIQIVNEGFLGSGLKHLNKSYLENIKIPSLSLPHQEEIVEFLDKEFQLYDINLLSKQIKDMPLFTLLIYKQYDLFSNALHLIYRKMESDALHLKMERDKKAVFNILVGGLKCEKYKLGDIVEIQNLKSSKIEKADENGKYPFYNCSILGHLWTNEFVYDDEVLLINKTNGSGKYKVYYNNGKFNISGGLLIFKPIIKICKYKYLLNYINYNEHIFSKFYEGSDKKNINRESFLNYKINIPSIQDQEKIIKEIEKIESEQSSYAEYAKMLQTQIDLISKLITNITKTNNNIRENNIPEDTPEETPNNTPVETPDITPEEDSEEALEEEPEYETIEHEGKNYYLDGKKVYRINKDKSLGKYYGRYKNDKVIRASEEANKEEKKIVVKAKANVKAKE